MPTRVSTTAVGMIAASVTSNDARGIRAIAASSRMKRGVTVGERRGTRAAKARTNSTMSGYEPVSSRKTPERRNLNTRDNRIWTEAERDRFIAEVREARRDEQAVTVQAGDIVEAPKSGSEGK